MWNVPSKSVGPVRTPAFSRSAAFSCFLTSDGRRPVPFHGLRGAAPRRCTPIQRPTPGVPTPQSTLPGPVSPWARRSSYSNAHPHELVFLWRPATKWHVKSDRKGAIKNLGRPAGWYMKVIALPEIQWFRSRWHWPSTLMILSRSVSPIYSLTPTPYIYIYIPRAH